MIEGVYIGNRGGVPFVTATQVSAGDATTVASYTLPDHTFRCLGRMGIMVMKVTLASGGTVPGVTMTVNNTTLPVTSTSGAAITSLPVSEYILLFNKHSNTLLIINV